MDAPMEDKLTVQMFGPGGVVIYEETVPIWLDPEAPLRYSVAVPSEIGEPQGMRIIVHDPAVVDWIIEKGQAVVTSIFNVLVGGSNPESGFSLTIFPVPSSSLTAAYWSFKGSITLRACSAPWARVMFSFRRRAG